MNRLAISRAANLAMFLFLVVLSWCFKASYFSFAVAIFIIFLLCDIWYSYRNHEKIFPDVSRPFKYMASAIFSLYILFILTAIFHFDGQDVHKAIEYAYLSIPFFMTWWISAKYSVSQGVRWGILVGAIIACIIGGYQWYFHPGMRLYSSYANPNHFGTMIDITLPLILYYMVKYKNKSYRLLSAMTIFTQLCCLYATSSRGALIGLAAGMVFSTLVSLFIVKGKITPLVKKICIILTVVIILFGGFGAYRMGHARPESQLGGERAFMAEASVEMWEDYKLIGVGASHWQENYYGKYHPVGASEQGLTMPHNMMLYFLSTGGIIGGFGFITFYVFSFLGIYQSLKKRNELILCICVFIPFFAFFIQGLVDTTIINKIPARMYFAIMGCIVTLSASRLIANSEIKQLRE